MNLWASGSRGASYTSYAKGPGSLALCNARRRVQAQAQAQARTELIARNCSALPRGDVGHDGVQGQSVWGRSKSAFGRGLRQLPAVLAERDSEVWGKRMQHILGRAWPSSQPSPQARRRRGCTYETVRRRALTIDYVGGQVVIMHLRNFIAVFFQTRDVVPDPRGAPARPQGIAQTTIS